MQTTVIYLENREYIALCDLLKLAGLTDSGGQAKAAIADGAVCRNGSVETRKTAKIRPGETVTFNGATVQTAAGSPPEA